MSKHEVKKIEGGVLIGDIFIATADYAKATDKMVFVSDETGLSVDDRAVNRADLILWKLSEGETL